MAIGYVSPFAFWTGGAGAVASSAIGVRSLLAPWVGGAGAAPGVQPGYRSLLAPWVGGAGANTAGQPGYLSLLAPWVGGAGAFADIPIPPTEPHTGGGGAPPLWLYPVPSRLRHENVDDVLILIATHLAAAGELH